MFILFIYIVRGRVLFSFSIIYYEFFSIFCFKDSLASTNISITIWVTKRYENPFSEIIVRLTKGFVKLKIKSFYVYQLNQAF